MAFESATRMISAAKQIDVTYPDYSRSQEDEAWLTDLRRRAITPNRIRKAFMEHGDALTPFVDFRCCRCRKNIAGAYIDKHGGIVWLGQPLVSVIKERPHTTGVVVSSDRKSVTFQHRCRESRIASQPLKTSTMKRLVLEAIDNERTYSELPS